MEIMKLLPAGKDYLWGGTRLREEFQKNIPLEPLAETWECSVHPDGPSTVANGAYEGKTLREVLENHPEYLGAKVAPGTGLPILVKFIDARQDLSVQVHPDDDYARLHENQNGKTEMWYVLDAAEGASLIYGFEHPVTGEILRHAIQDGSLDKHLQRVRIQKDDVFYVPAGLVHGIGAGALIAEIQESSNVTYRVYDYNRRDKHGNTRPLHFEKAVDVMDMRPAPNLKAQEKLIHYMPGSSRELICRCKYFEAEKIRITKEMQFSVRQESFQILLCLEGHGQVGILNQDDSDISFQKGDCLFFPASLGRCRIQGTAKLLKIRC